MSKLWILSPITEVISLRTALKRRPGKKIAIFIGAVTAILILSYNLSKDIWFIYITDKEGILTLQNSESTEIISGNPAPAVLWFKLCAKF